MPDGTTARCYAEAIAQGLAQNAYPDGFGAHYWHPERLNEPYSIREPRGVFLDSMGDLMGHWVPDEQVIAVLKVVQACEWHTFFLLTKNAPRLMRFIEWFTPNLLVGVSMPPTFLANQSLLSDESREKYLLRALSVLNDIHLRGGTIKTWMSFEPLSFDVAPLLSKWVYLNTRPLPLSWYVIGAASSGKNYYQPEREWVTDLLYQAGPRDACGGVPVFMKGNLDWSPRREEWPATSPVQMKMAI
jgi:hypothetical protein